MNGFIENPGRPGAFGALLDETARAVEEMCVLVEAKTREQFLETRQSSDVDTSSIQAICTHCVQAVYAYSNYIRSVVDLERDETGRPGPTDLQNPNDFREQMKRALRHTEATVVPLQGITEKAASKLVFTVRWGPTYDPEMILEHGVVHILRHRRQLERWGAR